MVADFGSTSTVAQPRDGSDGALLPVACRRLVVVAPRLADEVRGAALIRGGAATEVDVLGLTSPTAPSTADDLEDLADEPVDPHDAAVREPYAGRGVSEVRRHRLGLGAGAVAAREVDVVAALSEILGWAHPAGLCVLAPPSGETPGAPGDQPDADAAGRAAELVCAAYRVRLLTWSAQAPATGARTVARSVPPRDVHTDATL